MPHAGSSAASSQSRRAQGLTNAGVGERMFVSTATGGEPFDPRFRNLDPVHRRRLDAAARDAMV